MSIQNESVAQYLSNLSARAATPGGGAVAAITGAQAAGLIAMVAEFSEKSLEESTRAHLIERANAAVSRFTELADLDAEKFAALMAAYKAKSGVQDALEAAAVAPLECLSLASDLSAQLKVLEHGGNQNLITDTGIAASLLSSTIEASEMNVRISLRSIKSNEFVSHASKEIESARGHLADLQGIASRINDNLG